MGFSHVDLSEKCQWTMGTDSMINRAKVLVRSVRIKNWMTISCLVSLIVDVFTIDVFRVLFGWHFSFTLFTKPKSYTNKTKCCIYISHALNKLITMQCSNACERQCFWFAFELWCRFIVNDDDGGGNALIMVSPKLMVFLSWNRLWNLRRHRFSSLFMCVCINGRVKPETNQNK